MIIKVGIQHFQVFAGKSYIGDITKISKAQWLVQHQNGIAAVANAVEKQKAVKLLFHLDSKIQKVN